MAKENKLRIACHTYPSVEGINNALDIHADTIEHAAPLNTDIMLRIKKQNVIIVPTFVAASDEFSLNELQQNIDIDIGMMEEYNALNYSRNYSKPLRKEGVPESIRDFFNRLIAHLPQAINNNLLIGIGTDAGCPGTNFSSAIREMFLLSQLGATKLKVLQYATINGSIAIGDNKTGYIEPERYANLVILSENPLKKLGTLMKPNIVVKRGVVLDNQLNSYF